MTIREDSEALENRAPTPHRASPLPLPIDRDDAANDAINGGNERVINKLDAEIERNRIERGRPTAADYEAQMRGDGIPFKMNDGMEVVIKLAEDKPLNTPHVVSVGAPLLRPGLTISATCSEKYVVTVAQRLMRLARDFNATQA